MRQGVPASIDSEVKRSEVKQIQMVPEVDDFGPGDVVKIGCC